MSLWTSSPIGRSAGCCPGSTGLSISRPGFSSVVLFAGCRDSALDQTSKDEAHDRCAGKRDAWRVAHEVARVVDQFVRIFRSDAVGDILDLPGGTTGIF